MDTYPTEYLFHLTEFVVVCGLDPGSTDVFKGIEDNPLHRTSEPMIQSDEPLIEQGLAASLMSKFHDKSKSLAVWEPLAAKASARQVNHFLRIRFTERNFKLLLVKDRSSSLGPDDEYTYSNGDRHSAISPRNPASELYPDGLFTIHWIQKYLYILPSTVVSFYQLSSNPDYDTQLGKELAQLKKNLVKRNVKLVVVLVFEQDSDGSKAVSERIYNLRRGSGLQPRTGLLSIPHNSTDTEKETLVETICQLSYSESMEFYTNIAKSLRKRKGRSHLLTPQAELTKPPLSTAGWEVRYNFKLATLAELRQDLDFSLNCYETAYDSILELFVVLSPSVSSAQWNQARQLLDIVAFKIVRICLYQKRSNSAYKKFDIHLQSVTSILHQKGLEKETYQYINWLAQQYKLLGDLVRYSGDNIIPRTRSLAVSPDENSPSSRLPRSGFLYLEAVELMQGLAKLPQNDDTYMASKYDIDEQMKRLLKLSAEDFSCHKDISANTRDVDAVTQKRSIGYTLYQLGETYFATEDYENALKNYKTAANIYYNEGWNVILEPLLQKIIQCSLKLTNGQDRGLSILEFALVRNSSTGDLSDQFKGLNIREEEIHLDEMELDILEYGFTFQADTLYCGSDAHYQLYLKPLIQRGTLVLENIRLEFEGLPDVVLENSGSGASPDTDDTAIEILDLTDPSLKASLEFNGCRPKAFLLKAALVTAGEARLKSVSASMSVKIDNITIKALTLVRKVSPLYLSTPAVPWYTTKLLKKHVLIETPGRASILPRPARLKVSQSINYAVTSGENVPVFIEVENQESESIEVLLQASINVAEGDEVIELEWLDDHERVVIDPGKSLKFGVRLQVPYIMAQSLTFEIVASYTVGADEDVIRDVTSHFIEIGKPFRVNFVLEPIARPDSWHNIFVPDTTDDAVPLIIRRWDLSAMLLFLGQGNIEIIGSRLVVKSEEGSDCNLVGGEKEKLAVEDIKRLGYNESHKLSFIFDCWKRSETDARAVTAEAELVIKWKRCELSVESSVAAAPINELKLPSVKLTLPLYEPRVILDIEKTDNTIQLIYRIENATSHILTYIATMGSSAFFAFQGPKVSSLRLLPYSRRTLKFNIIPLKKDKAAVVPPLKVHDTYYKRTLVVMPANKDIRQDRSDLIISTEDM